jgi:hypothetical protein
MTRDKGCQIAPEIIVFWPSKPTWDEDDGWLAGDDECLLAMKCDEYHILGNPLPAEGSCQLVQASLSITEIKEADGE